MRIKIKRKLKEALSYDDHFKDDGSIYYVIDQLNENKINIYLIENYIHYPPALKGEPPKAFPEKRYKNLGYFAITVFKPHLGGDCLTSSNKIFKPIYVKSYGKGKGKGPILYDLALSYCKQIGAWFAPDIHSRISETAQVVWNYYLNNRRDELEIMQYDNHEDPFITPDDPSDDCYSKTWENWGDKSGENGRDGWKASPWTKIYRLKSTSLIDQYEANNQLFIYKDNVLVDPKHYAAKEWYFDEKKQKLLDVDYREDN